MNGMEPDGFLGQARALLDGEGWEYEDDGDALRFVVSHEGCKWSMVLASFSGNGLCLFAVYPWKVPAERSVTVMTLLNGVNHLLRVGCFSLMPEDGRVMYRSGIRVCDAYSCTSQLREVLLSCVAVVSAHWDVVGLAVNGGGPRPEKREA